MEKEAAIKAAAAAQEESKWKIYRQRAGFIILFAPAVWLLLDQHGPSLFDWAQQLVQSLPDAPLAASPPSPSPPGPDEPTRA